MTIYLENDGRLDHARIKEVQFKRDCTRALHGLAGGPCICQSIWREDGRSFSSWYAPVLVGLNPAKPEISAKQHPGNSITRSNGMNYAPVSSFRRNFPLSCFLPRTNQSLAPRRKRRRLLRGKSAVRDRDRSRPRDIPLPARLSLHSAEQASLP